MANQVERGQFDVPAFPNPDLNGDCFTPANMNGRGATIRQLAVIAAMQGLVTGSGINHVSVDPNFIAQSAITFADAVLAHELATRDSATNGEAREAKP